MKSVRNNANKSHYVSFVEKALKKALYSNPCYYEYIDTSFLLRTSNTCEIVFSKTETALIDHVRKHVSVESGAINQISGVFKTWTIF